MSGMLSPGLGQDGIRVSVEQFSRQEGMGRGRQQRDQLDTVTGVLVSRGRFGHVSGMLPITWVGTILLSLSWCQFFILVVSILMYQLSWGFSWLYSSSKVCDVIFIQLYRCY